ncbi:MAG: cysteine synthase A [Coprobacillus sp.]
MEFYNHLSELIGHTPILKLNHIKENNQLSANIFAKLEYYNPAGSIKDRVAKQMIEDAIEDGRIQEGATIIEPTSGNTGIGLCAVGATLGFDVIIVMPDTMSEERRTIMKAFGAKLVLTPGAKGMAGAISKAEELAQEIPNSFIPGQFVTPSNAKAHRLTTGPEIDHQLDGNIDILVAGVGTGGTISGVGQYLKNKYPHVQVVAVEPADSPVLSEGKSGPHGIQGIGAGFIPEALDTSIYDEIITIQTQEAYEGAREIAKTEGILVGISSGAALYAAMKIAKRSENKNKNIVVILPDGGDRYLSTDLFL